MLQRNASYFVINLPVFKHFVPHCKKKKKMQVNFQQDKHLDLLMSLLTVITYFRTMMMPAEEYEKTVPHYLLATPWLALSPCFPGTQANF